MAAIEKSEKLYHGSNRRIDGALKPVLLDKGPDYEHAKPAVFAASRKDVAALFMLRPDVLASIGFEKDIAYICIWGSAEEFAPEDNGGFLYALSPEKFQKVGKEYEWQSFEEVMPVEVKEFAKAINGMIESGVQVYFVDENAIFDRIVAEKGHRTPILSELTSENRKRGINAKGFG